MDLDGDATLDFSEFRKMMMSKSMLLAEKIDLFPHQGWIAARSAYWTTKEHSEPLRKFCIFQLHGKGC